jgi:hypothetical protein
VWNREIADFAERAKRSFWGVKRKRWFRFRFAWFRFVSPGRGELRRGRIRLESATGFGA